MTQPNESIAQVPFEIHAHIVNACHRLHAHKTPLSDAEKIEAIRTMLKDAGFTDAINIPDHILLNTYRKLEQEQNRIQKERNGFIHALIIALIGGVAGYSVFTIVPRMNHYNQTGGILGALGAALLSSYHRSKRDS